MVFPPDFLFGCATSAYQIEGGIQNDWSAWEAEGRLKEPDARCGLATDHWRRWRDDFQLLSELGCGAYRFSIEWARVEPEPGRYDEAVLAQYGEMVKDLRARGIEPFVTLLHFTHPSWFHSTSPWHEETADGPARFGRFVAKVMAAIGRQVRYFTVLNEPAVWLIGAYLAGVMPPGRTQLGELTSAAAGLLRGHAAAAQVIRAAKSDAQIGIAHNVMRFVPGRAAHPLDRIAASYLSAQYNHALLDAFRNARLTLGVVPGIRRRFELPELKGTLDFIGINYYSRVFLRARSAFPFADVVYEDRDGRGVSDLGWELHPEGLRAALLDMGRHGLPLYVTENGLDDRDDSRRAAFLYDHLGAVLAAQQAGADVRGYFHWSLLDNFEWLEAFGPRFGLYRVDYSSFARAPTRAAELYRQIIAARALPEGRPEERIKQGTGRVPVVSPRR